MKLGSMGYAAAGIDDGAIAGKNGDLENCFNQLASHLTDSWELIESIQRIVFQHPQNKTQDARAQKAAPPSICGYVEATIKAVEDSNEMLAQIVKALSDVLGDIKIA